MTPLHLADSHIQYLTDVLRLGKLLGFNRSQTPSDFMELKHAK